MALAAVEFGMAVLAVSSLSFLGFGAVPPTPGMGLADLRGPELPRHRVVDDHPAGLVIVAVVLSAHRLGHALEQREVR